MKYFAALLTAAVLFASVAEAETIPSAMLDKDYTACMGGSTADQDHERAEYCSCVRQAMKGWSLDQYGQVAMAETKAHSADEEPQQLQEVAKACITKVLGATPAQ